MSDAGGRRSLFADVGRTVRNAVGGIGSTGRLERPDSVPHLDTTDHFGVVWDLRRGWTERRYDRVGRTGAEPVTETSYAAREGVPGLDGDPAATVVVLAHGWGHGYEDGRTLVGNYGDWLAQRVDDDVTPVGFTYDAGPINTTYSKTKFHAYLDVARRNGRKLAQAVADMRAGGVKTVHLVGHSMGGAAVAAAVGQRTVDVTVDTVHLLGAAEHRRRFERTEGHPDATVGGGAYAPRLREQAGAVYNYHYRDDELLGTVFRLARFTTAVGETGADGPENLHNVPVEPTHHHTFCKPPDEGGVIDRVADRL